MNSGPLTALTALTSKQPVKGPRLMQSELLLKLLLIRQTRTNEYEVTNKRDSHRRSPSRYTSTGLLWWAKHGVRHSLRCNHQPPAVSLNNLRGTRMPHAGTKHTAWSKAQLANASPACTIRLYPPPGPTEGTGQWRASLLRRARKKCGPSAGPHGSLSRWSSSWWASGTSSACRTRRQPT